MRRRTGRKLARTLLPIVTLIAVAVAVMAAWLVYAATHPPERAYLVTPDRFQQLSERGLRATEEQWTNADGSVSRGWLLRGGQSAPAVIFLHPYGGNRSYFLNLGIKLNEATNFTALWMDARGHGAPGDNRASGASSFGVREAEDVGGAIAFLRSLMTRDNEPLIGGDIGLYGVEMGAYSALVAASSEPAVRSLVLDSVPRTPADLLRHAITERTGFDNALLHTLADAGARLRFTGRYPGSTACAAAAALNDQRVLLLAGADAGNLQAATSELQNCFPPQTRVETNLNLSLTGYRVASAPAIEADAYDRRVIEFLDRTLGSNE